MTSRIAEFLDLLEKDGWLQEKWGLSEKYSYLISMSVIQYLTKLGSLLGNLKEKNVSRFFFIIIKTCSSLSLV
jgi:hypothetical protein